MTIYPPTRLWPIKRWTQTNPVVQGLYVLLGVILGAVIPYALNYRSRRREELRDIRISLLEVRDLVWEGRRPVDNHIAKLRIRLHTLGFPRTALDEVSNAVEGCQIRSMTADEMGYDEDKPDTEYRVINSEGLHRLDRSLEEADLAIAQAANWVGRPHRRRPVDQQSS